MALVTPVTVYTGYTFASNNLSFPLASLPGLSAAEADATTGDVRAVLTALVDQANTALNALAANARPSNFTITADRRIAGQTVEVGWSVKGTFPLSVSALNYAPET